MTLVPETILEVRDLCVSYGSVEAVHHASLRVREGELVTVIGANGAGKTTLLTALVGMIEARGEIYYCGKNQSGIPTERRVAAGLSLVPERRELFVELSVEDNLLLGAFHRYRQGERDLHDDLAKVYALFPRLKEPRAQWAGTLSGGERQMVALGRALMTRPRLLMLDEPSLGLAPMVVRETYQTIEALRRTGVAILLVEQNANAALQLADYGYVLETGTIVLEGPSAELAANPRVAESYLGMARKHRTADV
jgi:branched-chain amino acid transport system ATP-binding protein